jgi:hypothetical protein
VSNGKKRASEIWAQTWPLLSILVATVVSLGLLSWLARRARTDGTIVDVEQALTWGKELLGLAGTLAGFLGVSTATVMWTDLTPERQSIYAAGGLTSFLAGATLMDVGGWPIPAALAAMVIGTMAMRLRMVWNE